MRPRAGQVWTFDSGFAPHPKHHLCVHEDYRFLFLNAPRGRIFPSDLLIRNADVPFLPPTPCGRSTVSCSTLVEIEPVRFRVLRPVLKGEASEEAMRQLVDHLLGCRSVSDEKRERAMDGLGAFFRWDGRMTG